MNTVDIDAVLRSEINKQKTQLTNDKLKQISEKYNFRIKDVNYLKESFIKMAPRKVLTLQLWKKAMGTQNMP